jgi:hypothetical protein
MRQLDLQPPFRRRRALAKDFEDQAGPVDDLCLGDFLQAFLLDRRQGRIDDQQTRLILCHHLGDRLGLPLAEQGRGPWSAQPECAAVEDVDANRLRQARSLVEARVDAAQVFRRPVVGQGEDGALAARDSSFIAAVEDAQDAFPSVAGSPSSA